MVCRLSALTVHYRTLIYYRAMKVGQAENNNNIYFAKGQVNQKGKSPSKLATIKA